MRDELGFSRYGAHGGDLGAGVTSRLARPTPSLWSAYTCWQSLTLPATTRQHSPRRNGAT